MEVYRTILGVSVLSLFATCLSGCATTSRYEAKVSSWKGENSKALVRSWGNPDAVEKMSNGDQMFVYARLHHAPLAYGEVHRSIASVSSQPQTGSAQTGPVYIECATYFEVSPQNVIVATQFRGDECKSSD